MSAFAYPVALDLTGRPCLVVGGGVVAERKVSGLLEAGARVTVVSPSLCAALLALATDGRFGWWPREYTRGDVEGFFLVMSTTDDPAVNDAVAVDARAGGVLVNCADDPARCDFILPSVLRRGAVTVAVSTGGASPIVARLVREEIEVRLPEGYAALIEVVAGARRALRARGVSVDANRWRSVLDAELRELVATGRAAEAHDRLLERLGEGLRPSSEPPPGNRTAPATPALEADRHAREPCQACGGAREPMSPTGPRVLDRE